jgi:hypothetical protein
MGKDISKFFYGGYALDSNANAPGSSVPSWTHSNIARKIANKLAVAALVRKDTSIFKAVITNSHDITSTTKTFNFSLSSDDIS